jgi:hypothetical protein
MKEFPANQQGLGDRIGALELSVDPQMGDGALEAAASAGTPYTQPRQFGGTCVGDEALEAAASAGPSPGATRPQPFGYCIGDEALEAAAAAAQPARPFPPAIRGLSCIDDRALEFAQRETHPMPTRFGPCIDDRALEEAAALVAAGPTSSPAFCLPTMPGRCIDGAVVENMAVGGAVIR